MNKTENFGIVRATIDDQTQTVNLFLKKKPEGSVSVIKLRRWALDSIRRKYPNFTINDRCNSGLYK